MQITSDDLAELHAKSGEALALDQLAFAHDGFGAGYLPAEIHCDPRIDI